MPLANIANRGSAEFLFLGTALTNVTKVISTKRRDIFVECPRGGRRPTFIFITIVIVHRVSTGYLPMVEVRSGTSCEEVLRGARMAPKE